MTVDVYKQQEFRLDNPEERIRVTNVAHIATVLQAVNELGINITGSKVSIGTNHYSTIKGLVTAVLKSLYPANTITAPNTLSVGVLMTVEQVEAIKAMKSVAALYRYQLIAEDIDKLFPSSAITNLDDAMQSLNVAINVINGGSAVINFTALNACIGTARRNPRYGTAIIKLQDLVKFKKATAVGMVNVANINKVLNKWVAIKDYVGNPHWFGSVPNSILKELFIPDGEWVPFVQPLEYPIKLRRAINGDESELEDNNEAEPPVNEGGAETMVDNNNTNDDEDGDEVYDGDEEDLYVYDYDEDEEYQPQNNNEDDDAVPTGVNNQRNLTAEEANRLAMVLRSMGLG